MSILRSAISSRSPEFQANTQRMAGLVATLRDAIGAIHRGGGPVACKRHTDRGKLLPRDRVHELLDPGSPPPTACMAMRPPAPG
jgi:3-methylcrotonyl-CoA carboxylase beta subunit